MKSSKLFFAILTLLLMFNTACFRKVVVDNSNDSIDPYPMQKLPLVVKVSLQNLESEPCYQALPLDVKEIVQGRFATTEIEVESPFDKLPPGEYNLVSDRLYTARFAVSEKEPLKALVSASFSQDNILVDQKLISLEKECNQPLSTENISLTAPYLLPAKFKLGANDFIWLETRKIDILFHQNHMALGSRYLDNPTSHGISFMNSIIVRKTTDVEFEVYKIENYGSSVDYPSFNVWVGHYVRTSTP